MEKFKDIMQYCVSAYAFLVPGYHRKPAVNIKGGDFLNLILKYYSLDDKKGEFLKMFLNKYKDYVINIKIFH